MEPGSTFPAGGGTASQYDHIDIFCDRELVIYCPVERSRDPRVNRTLLRKPLDSARGDRDSINPLYRSLSYLRTLSYDSRQYLPRRRRGCQSIMIILISFVIGNW